MRERARLGLGERLEMEAAVEAAFEPLRRRRTSVGPTRVRAAVRWGRAEPAAAVPWAGAIARLSELGVAVGMSAFVFAGALTSVPPAGAPVPVTEVEVIDDILEAPVPVTPHWTVRVIPAEDDLNALVRWLKFGRTSQVYDSIDAATPPVAPAPAARPEPLHLRLLRTLIPVR